MAKEEKKPETKEPAPQKGLAVIIYPQTAGRYRVVSAAVEGEKVGKPEREMLKDAKRSAIACAEDMLIALAQERMK